MWVELRGLPKSQVSQAVEILVGRGFFTASARQGGPQGHPPLPLRGGSAAGPGGPRTSGRLLAADLFRADGAERHTLDTLLDRVFATMEQELKGALQGMNRKNVDLGTGPVGRLLFSLALPTITSQIVNMLYNLVDRYTSATCSRWRRWASWP